MFKTCRYQRCIQRISTRVIDFPSLPLLLIRSIHFHASIDFVFLFCRPTPCALVYCVYRYIAFIS